MAKQFPIKRTDSYEEMGATYQVIEIARLNEVLKRHKLAPTLRRKICKAYFFENGVFLDSGWFKLGKKQLFPTVCFAERPVDPDEGLGEIAKLYMPSEFFSYHEYTDGVIHEYFKENGEQINDVEHGNL